MTARQVNPSNLSFLALQLGMEEYCIIIISRLGDAVVTLADIKKDGFILEYHGTRQSKSEGIKLLKVHTQNSRGSYVYFLKNRETQLR